MGELLRELQVLALDCQASGASPAHGDLLELGWAICGESGLLAAAQSVWIVPRTERPIRRPIRELTGWSEACVAKAVSECDAWKALCREAAELARPPSARAPTVIHFARFELSFLRDLHERLGAAREFPFDTVCLHAIAARLFPELPRRNIRALAGYLGHSPALMRRAAGHVEATAFIWRALVPRLEHAGVGTWSELGAWLERAPSRAREKRRVYPFGPERRRALPDRPGVYRFLRPNGDVIYVGKAASLKRRVASHFQLGGRATERGLELLTQVHDLGFCETASLLEAALLESDEIKRLDPPYNVQLRAGDRSAWFAARDLWQAAPAPDRAHRIGPLPSRRALAPLAALVALAQGESPSPRLAAIALAVPVVYLPDPQLFADGWQGFAGDYLDRAEPSAARRIDRAARALWRERGRREPEPAAEEAPPTLWDLARVRRRLERNLVQAGLLARRTRWLCLLADADVAFRERDMEQARALVFARGALIERRDLAQIEALASLPARRPSPQGERQRAFDAASYDRLRILATELRRVQDDGGEVAVRIGRHHFAGVRLAKLMSAV